MTDTELKNILCIESGPGLGGSAFSLYRVLKNRDTDKFRIYVFCYYDAPIFEKIEALGVPVIRLPIRQLFPEHLVAEDTLIRRGRNFLSLYGNLLTEILTNGRRLARFIKDENIAVVHCNNGIFENFSAVAAARIAGVPCISDVKGTEPLLKLERMFSNWVVQTMVLNRAMFDQYATVFGPERVNLLFECVDLDSTINPATEKIRAEFSIQPDEFCVATFVRLVEGKGVPEFIRAAGEVLKARTNIRFFIIGNAVSGGADYEDGLRSLVSELGIEQHVVFTGWRSDVIDIMSAMQLVLQISTTFPEGMPLAPIEAMSLAKPVVVSDIAGYADIVDDRETGFVVPAGDVIGLASAINRIADDEELAARLGAAGLQKVFEHFDARIRARRIEEIYEAVLS